MEIGIGLPATIPGTQGATILEWARRADAGPFSSLAVLDRLVYPNFEPLMTLAAAASVTQRARLMTTVLLAPLRNAGILAKQAASLDALSAGRLTLGLGIGAREDDFNAAPASFKGRGRHFEQQIALMRRAWSGEPVSEQIGPIGPPPVQPGGPPILVGGYSPQAARRAGLLADGFIAGGGASRPTIRQFYDTAHQAWQEAGRPGRPRFVCCSYWALGPDAEAWTNQYIGHYYSALGPRVPDMIRAIPKTPEAIRATIQDCEQIGADELILWPCVPELDQVNQLADLIR